MTKHTTIPWEVEKTELSLKRILAFSGKTPFGIAKDVNEANARFIVTACNCHDDLLGALKEYVKVVGGIHENECPQDDTCSCKWKYINDKVNQAVAKAEGRN